MFCVVRDVNTNKYYGKMYEEGYYYSEYTNESGHVEICWRGLQFFIGMDNEDSCGLIIFESKKKATEYITIEWCSIEFEVIFIKDL